MCTTETPNNTNIWLFHFNTRANETRSDKPGLFCVDPKRPPVLVVAPNADVPKPPVVPKPVSADTEFM